MARLGEIWRRIVFSLRRSQMESDLAEEMRDHLERKSAKNAASGMAAEEARYAAQRQLGNSTLQQEESRASWSFPILENLSQDVRYGMRGLRRAPGFSTVAILTLALGIGSTTAIFSIVNAIVLRPLPFRDSERIVSLSTRSPMFPQFYMGVSNPDYDDIRSQARSFEALTLYQEVEMSLTGAGEPEKLSGAAVTPGFLEVFAIHPERGRDFQSDDLQIKNGNVVLITHGLWQRKFGGDPNILGKTLTFDQKPYTVVGVLPPEFDLGYAILVPLVLSDGDRINRHFWFCSVYARLKQETRLPSAQVEMNAIAARIAAQDPKEDSGIQFKVSLLREETVEKSKSKLLVLLGAVSFLLMIVCANVGNLVLARGIQRQREISMRAALGASRGRIVRQLLTESLLLALLGGAAGMLVAIFAIDGFKAFAPAEIPRLNELRLEPAIAWFGLVISTFAGIVCGLHPALPTSRGDLIRALKDRATASMSSRMSQPMLRSLFVISEVALALVLLTGSALMVQSLVRTLKVDAGFRTDHLLTAELSLPKTRYASDEARQIFIHRLWDELHKRPELSSAALSNFPTLGGLIAIQTFDPKTLGLDEKPTTLLVKSVDADYFSTLGIPLRSGRFFSERDTAATPVVVINESLARHFFPGQNPLGRILRFGIESADQHQIIGIVADVHDVRLREQPRPQVYLPLLNAKARAIHLYIRTKTDDPGQLASALQQSVWAVDKDLPVSQVQSMAAIISNSVTEPRFWAWLLSAFALVGLALTLIGIYGVISYSVRQRTQEIGIRMALGAQPENVLRLILGQGLRLALVGTAVGLAGAFALTRLIAGELFGVKPADPATLTATVLLMLVVASVAAYIPARRATRVDPVVALRQE